MVAQRKLSILVPLYNEEDLVGTLLERVIEAPLPDGVTAEIIVVDDGSTDGSVAIVSRLIDRFPDRIRLIRHERNEGKGAALRTALNAAGGDYAITQDADLEYDPAEYGVLLRPLLRGDADVVYGSRFALAGERRALYFWHSVANRLLTTLCNAVSDLNLTDMETGFKAFRLPLAKSIPWRSKRFGIEPELTLKFAKRGARFFEVPISYRGRTYAEGKKIGWPDALQAMGSILRFGLSRDIHVDRGAAILDALANTPNFNAWMASAVDPHVGKRVLEIGAGIGNVSLHLARQRDLYIASDVDEERLSRLQARFRHRPNVRVQRCDLTDAADFLALENSVDSVVCLNVLEHVENDLRALENIRLALEPGGKLVLLVPQGPEIFGTLDEALGHRRRYTVPDLRARLERAGFAVERVFAFNRVSRPAWYFNGRILKRRHFGRFQLFVVERLVWLWRRLDHQLPWNSVSVIAIARKR